MMLDRCLTSKNLYQVHPVFILMFVAETEVKYPEDLLKFVVSAGDCGVMCSLCAKTFKNKRMLRIIYHDVHIEIPPPHLMCKILLFVL